MLNGPLEDCRMLYKEEQRRFFLIRFSLLICTYIYTFVSAARFLRQINTTRVIPYETILFSPGRVRHLQSSWRVSPTSALSGYQFSIFQFFSSAFRSSCYFIFWVFDLSLSRAITPFPTEFSVSDLHSSLLPFPYLCRYMFRDESIDVQFL